MKPSHISLGTCSWLSMSLLFCPSVLAAGQPAEGLDGYFRVLWGLCIVLAVMLVLFAVVRKRFSIINPRSQKNIRVKEIQPIAPRKAICLVEVHGREFLLGVGNESITLLADFDRQKHSGSASFDDVLTTTRNETSS